MPRKNAKPQKGVIPCGPFVVIPHGLWWGIHHFVNRWIPALGPAGMTALCFSGILSICSYARAEDLAEHQARVAQVTGDVGLLSQGAVDWIAPKEGLPLEPGDKIRTGEDGRVELAISEDTLWVLEPETEMLLERMESNEGRFQLSSGTLLGTVDSARAAGRAQLWEINTPVAVVAIRGTQFALHFTRALGARLGVQEGTVEIQPAETAQGMPEPSRVSAGQEALAARGKPLQMLREPSPTMKALERERRMLKRRQRRVQSTWTLFTPSVRKEMRSKLVAPPPKTRPRRPVAPRQRRSTKH